MEEGDANLGNTFLPKCIANHVLLSATSGIVYYTSREACAASLPDEASTKLSEAIHRYNYLSDKAGGGFAAMTPEERSELLNLEHSIGDRAEGFFRY